MVLWISADLCSRVSQQYRGINPPGGMELDLRPFTIPYVVYLHYLDVRIRGTVVITECACEDLP